MMGVYKGYMCGSGRTDHPIFPTFGQSLRSYIRTFADSGIQHSPVRPPSLAHPPQLSVQHPPSRSGTDRTRSSEPGFAPEPHSPQSLRTIIQTSGISLHSSLCPFTHSRIRLFADLFLRDPRHRHVRPVHECPEVRGLRDTVSRLRWGRHGEGTRR